MPKYLVIASYTADGAKGLLSDGGTKRKEVAAKLAKDLGGKLESFYFGFGSDDVYATFDAPDNAAAAALGLTISASGAIQARTVVLITPEELDETAKKAKDVGYSPPGK